MKLSHLIPAILAMFLPHVFAAEAPSLAADALKVLDESAAFHAKQPGATAEISGVMVQEMPGEERQELKVKGSFAISRPNLLALRLDADGGVSFVSDGKTTWAHVAELKQFIADDAPAKLEDLIRDNPHLGMMAGQAGPVLDMFRDQPREVLLNGVQFLKVAGTGQIAGVECVRLHGEQEEMDWDLWIQTGDTPALRRFSFDPMKGIRAQAPEEVRAQIKDARMTVTIEYHGWKFGAAPPADAFAFLPPKDAKKVADFTPPDEPEGGDPAAELKGKPAPDFALDLLDGGKMTLAAHKGKNIVILDFWATWCGPCVRALPMVAEVAAAYKDRGIVLYAVNQQEEPDAVKKFLAAKKLEIPVPMDAKGDAARLYKVSGIPQTVVIGKDGNVAVVHVGFSPALKEELAKEIEALLKQAE